ncbi:hypothetical protein GOP47_0004738 [Adiantum capillus-veneris]|uniref:VTT domain-containing protein n=1 Tax=Adiantum capillus-veneris TaxID=13818 RepID=A0A9D4V3T7_ADICA|nr:hypothetical protein GOP47_0004738 [Adiantum capillus-veneris]
MMMRKQIFGQLGVAALVAVAAVAYFIFSSVYSGDKQALLDDLRSLSQRLGPWSLPLYVAIHALLISLCLPYALLFEAGAAYLFGFFTGVLCVFSAKILSASLSFWIGRNIFRSSSSARHWVESNKVFNVISNGVARDGWKFVLLARFSPVPSYLINYSIAATNVRFVDFLLPTILGCIPMILQNTSIGSLTRAATHTHAKGEGGGVLSYLLPAMGVTSSVLIAWRIKRYTSGAFPTPVTVERSKDS